MSNGFQQLSATSTVITIHEFLRCARTLKNIVVGLRSSQVKQSHEQASVCNQHGWGLVEDTALQSSGTLGANPHAC